MRRRPAGSVVEQITQRLFCRLVPVRVTLRESDRSIGAQLDSMRAVRQVIHTRKITVVDDVVTKGSTLLALASHVKDGSPDAKVRAFALVRTTGLLPEVESIVAPGAGLISVNRWGP